MHLEPVVQRAVADDESVTAARQVTLVPGRQAAGDHGQRPTMSLGRRQAWPFCVAPSATDRSISVNAHDSLWPSFQLARRNAPMLSVICCSIETANPYLFRPSARVAATSLPYAAGFGQHLLVAAHARGVPEQSRLEAPGLPRTAYRRSYSAMRPCDFVTRQSILARLA